MKLVLVGVIHDPTDPVSLLLFKVLAMSIEFESDVIRARTRQRITSAIAELFRVVAARCTASCSDRLPDKRCNRKQSSPRSPHHAKHMKNVFIPLVC
ncbi:hypothetical protein [Arthrobacter oryzae]|uniref:hypothetical protein n=1 Tax=Arthrobacter oryzae TaxID=409290 RepID=UPI001FC97298|nr:hypothetical protein [Arthrobacter oryzae]